MAANGTGQISTDNGTSESQANLTSFVGRANSAPSTIEGLRGGFHSQATQNVTWFTPLGNGQVGVSWHHSTGSIPFFAENGAASSQLMRAHKDFIYRFVSQAGDIGDRVVSRRASPKDREQEIVVSDIPEELLDSCGFWSHHPNKSKTISPVSPLFSEIMPSPPFTTSLLDKNQEEKIELSPSFEYIAYLIHLAVFAIFGILTRYLLQKLFGPTVAGVTSDQSILYLDLPSNMVGSFLMGWFGVVFKGKISHVSDQLAVGISTGYLGSLTTFSGWNQKMLDLSVNGHWVFALLGFVIGLFLAAYSIIIGIETAKGFSWLLERIEITSRLSKLRVNSYKSHVIVLSVMMLVWCGLWSTSGILVKKEFRDGGSGAQLWLGCLVGPLGVWLRWWLARFNGQGLGSAARWKWIPFGTLAANVSAACVMAALATTKKAVNTKNCDTVAGGIQLGLMGCLSTVSTFMAEFNAMRESGEPWRAYAYAFITIGISFALGTLIYSVPMWTMGYT